MSAESSPTMAKRIHHVSLLVGSDLVHLEPNGRDKFTYKHEGDDQRSVKGALIDDRFVPKDTVVILKPGESFDVTEDDIINALERVAPIERAEGSRLQILTSVYEESVFDPEELYPVVKPPLLLDPAEFCETWHDRIYVYRSKPAKEDAGYEREFVIRTTKGQLVHVHKARPAGYDETGHLLLRFLSFDVIG